MSKNIFFKKQNYMLIIGGLVVIAIGYIVMSGGGSEDPNVFNPEIFNHIHITLAPFLWLIGTLLILVGIMKKFGDDEVIEHELDLTSVKKK